MSTEIYLTKEDCNAIHKLRFVAREDLSVVFEHVLQFAHRQALQIAQLTLVQGNSSDPRAEFPGDHSQSAKDFRLQRAALTFQGGSHNCQIFLVPSTFAQHSANMVDSTRSSFIMSKNLQ